MIRNVINKEKSNNIVKPLNISNKIVNLFPQKDTSLQVENIDKIKNPHKYHKDLTIKERDAIIKQSVKIMELIKAIEDGVIAKDVLKFITKFYQLDKSYFE